MATKRSIPIILCNVILLIQILQIGSTMLDSMKLRTLFGGNNEMQVWNGLVDARSRMASSYSSNFVTFDGRLEVLKKSLNLSDGATVSCLIESEESRKPWNLSTITEVETPSNEILLYFNTSSPGCLKFELKAQQVWIALTDANSREFPKYSITLNKVYPFGNFSIIRNQLTNNEQMEMTPDVLDANEYRGFHLSWGKGVIELRKYNEDEKPFITLTDDEATIDSINSVGLKAFQTGSAFWRLKDINETCGGNPGTVQTVKVNCFTWNGK